MSIFISYSKQTDEHLMVLIVRNDTRAFEELYERYNKRLFHFILKMLDHEEEKAQDILQDLFLKLVERPHMFDSNRNFHTWIFTVAANLCRMQYRHATADRIQEHKKEMAGISSGESAIHQLDGILFSQRLEICLDKLSYEHRETFVLRFQEEFSLQEIAEIMNCSLGTVKSRIHYTTRKLALELKEFKTLLKSS